MNTHPFRSLLASGLLLITFQASAGLFDDFLNKGTEALKSLDSGSSTLSQPDIIAGLKQALEVGSQRAIEQLGQQDGYLKHPDVRIPIPSALEPVASSLRFLGQGDMVDQFQTTMNRAAERAAPEAAEIFVQAIQQMTLEDARKILNGPDNAATEYFRKNSSEQLVSRFLPIVREATDAAGVTASYKRMSQQVASLSDLIPQQALDLDQFVTEKAVEGLFTRIAAEEKLIRNNPAQRSTELLQKVFSQ